MQHNAEKSRLIETKEKSVPWKNWGPYLSERQWGTVREDYSDDGDAWNYFTHDQARSRAYRWGEDGIAGISDSKQILCFSMAFWNGKDPILKERLFGLTNSEGNHGEDVKEYYYYLDSTPTHSYMKYLYKYPHNTFPYNDLVETNKDRSRNQPEYELVDTGIFENDHYFDIFIEFAKESPESILVKISLCNRSSQLATIDILPTLLFRNTWSWGKESAKPILKQLQCNHKCTVISAHSEKMQDYFLYCEEAPLLFTDNETNNERIFATPNVGPYVKDGINHYVIEGCVDAVNPNMIGTKVSPHYHLSVEGGQTSVVRLKLSNKPPSEEIDPLGESFDSIFAARQREADEFYQAIVPVNADEDRARIIRQSMAGMLWSKQYYLFDVDNWLIERHADPFRANSHASRNKEWFHMVNDHIISMPDKWEYPWYAAWDLAFHAVALTTVDLDFAKEQLQLVLKEIYLHPSGQIPAYEWNFSDVNPPVHAWAVMFLSRTELGETGKMDFDFLKRSFIKLLLNFNWWVNRKDQFGKNIFEGGFLGLDNIGVFDRSSPLPTGGYLEQADGTAWMALFCQSMLELSIELISEDSIYEDMALKFGEHFLWIASAMNKVGEEGMWDEEDGFYYDLLQFPDGTSTRLKVRSMVGLLPICATTIIEPWQRNSIKNVLDHFSMRIQKRPEILQSVHQTGEGHYGCNERGILALVNEERLRKILTKMLDEDEFFSPFGIRALSKFHLENPYVFYVGDKEYRVDYIPGESDSGMFGGNSNWRGPIWLPTNLMIIRALLNYYLYYGDNFRIECPTGSGNMMNLFEVSHEIVTRLSRVFLRNEEGIRPVYGPNEKFQNDPYWKDHLLFYEYFNGDTGSGLGASHQTGWTGLIGKLLAKIGEMDPKVYLAKGKKGAFKK
ncbi:MAG: hypothetical protein Q8K75_11485 [Chlamydiales bacterium]|nr:hypothetical protein [Chlamydiales bacterium]